MKKVIVFLAVLTCLASLMGASNVVSQEKGYSRETIVINDSNTYLSCVQLVIRLKGLMEKYLPDGVTVEWTYVATSADIRDAVIANRVDIASIAVPSVIVSLENHLPLVIISGTAGSPIYLYSNNPEIKTFQDITKNSRISTLNKGSATHLSFLAKCKEVFGDPTIYDNNLVAMPNAEALASLETSNELDCAMFVIPSTVRANEISKITLIEDLTPIMLDYNMTSYFVTNEKFFKENPVLIEAFRKATHDSVEFINNNTKEVAVLLGEVFDIDPVYIEEALLICPPRLEVSGYDKTANLMYEAGILSETPMKFIDLSYYNEIPKADE